MLEQLQRGVPHLQHPHHGVVLHHVSLGRLQGHLAVEPGIITVNVELVSRLKPGTIDGRAVIVFTYTKKLGPNFTQLSSWLKLCYEDKHDEHLSQ